MEYVNNEHNIRLTVTAEYIERVLGFPFENARNNKAYHNHFRIIVSNGENGESFDYYGSAHDCDMGKKSLTDEDLQNALESIIDDALYGDMSFEEFCDELGMDSDSCTSYRMHKACMKTSGKLQNVITNQSDEWYTILNALQES